MEQPELGYKVLEIRNSKGLTQKELSELCNVDIRTIQRIETGEVLPRWSTIRILAAALDCDEKVFQRLMAGGDISKIKSLLVLSIIMGIIYFINWIFYTGFLPGLSFPSTGGLYIFQSLVHLLAGVLFFYGYFLLARTLKNKVLQISSLVIIITIPLFVITNLIQAAPAFYFADHINRVLLLIMGLNGVLFGIGLLRTKTHNLTYYNLAGLLQIIVSPLYIIPFPLVQLIGLYLSIPLIILLISGLIITLRNFRINI